MVIAVNDAASVFSVVPEQQCTNSGTNSVHHLSTIAVPPLGTGAPRVGREIDVRCSGAPARSRKSGPGCRRSAHSRLGCRRTRSRRQQARARSRPRAGRVVSGRPTLRRPQDFLAETSRRKSSTKTGVFTILRDNDAAPS